MLWCAPKTKVNGWLRGMWFVDVPICKRQAGPFLDVWDVPPNCGNTQWLFILYLSSSTVGPAPNDRAISPTKDNSDGIWQRYDWLDQYVCCMHLGCLRHGSLMKKSAVRMWRVCPTYNFRSLLERTCWCFASWAVAKTHVALEVQSHVGGIVAQMAGKLLPKYEAFRKLNRFSLHLFT